MTSNGFIACISIEIVTVRVDFNLFDIHLHTYISSNNIHSIFVDTGEVAADCNSVEPYAYRSEDAPLVQGNKYLI